MKIKEAFNYALEKLNKADIFDYKSDVEIIFSHLFNMKRTDVIVKGNDELSNCDFNGLEEVLEKRISHIPLSEIFGEIEFYGLKFKVNRNVLTPRKETELVLNEALKILENKGAKKVLDLCTGSGILGISIKKTHPDFMITMADISEEALEIAKENSKLNDVDVEIIKSDMFNSINNKYDLIISNPPYIEEGERDKLSDEVLLYDPEISLFGGMDGLNFYRIIAEKASNYLNKDGVLVLEIGYDQGESIKKLFEDKNFKSIEIKKDYANFDRIAIIKK